MTHVSTKLLHNRGLSSQTSLRWPGADSLRSALARLARWLPLTKRKVRRRKPGRRRLAKYRLSDLSDHELKDIGLTRDQLGYTHRQWRPDSSFSENEQLHKGLRDLQYDLLKRSKLDP